MYFSMLTALGQNPIIWLVVFFWLIGFLCGVHAILRLKNERKALEKAKNELPSLIKSHSKDEKEGLREWLEKQPGISKETPEKKGLLKGSHLVLRVQSLYRALLDENGSRQLPSLHDLHELTLQDEQGRKSNSCLRTIISFLLIVGILGTLRGIHDAVDNDVANTEMLRALKPALLPSMLAVCGTVLLMWLRGVYAGMTNHYLMALDTFTTTELVPKLQPKSDISTAIKKLQDSSKKLHNNMKSFENMANALKEVTDSMDKGTDTLDKISKELDDLKKETKNTMQSIEDLKNTKSSLEESLEEQSKEMEKELGPGIDKLKESTAEISNYNEAAQKAQVVLEKLKELADVSIKQLEDGYTNANIIAKGVEKLPERAGQIKQMREYLQKMEKQSKEVTEKFAQIKGYRDELIKARETAENATQQAKKDMRLTLDGITELSKTYAIDVDREKVSINAHVNKMEEEYGKVLTNYKNLCRYIKDRTKSLPQQ